MGSSLVLQHLEKIEELPESIKSCFAKMKETTPNLNVEVGAFITFYDNISPEIIHFSSQNQNIILKSDVDKALQTILANPNRENIQKIVAIHTHPTSEVIFPGHSNGDFYANKVIKDFLETTLDKEIKLESVVIPTYREYDEDYVFGLLVVTNKEKETGKLPIKAELSHTH